MSKDQLPAEVTDHFAKANVIHTYVQKSLGEAVTHVLEAGQELLAAKAAIPHGGWEEKCGKLFDGSLRTAQYYMQFAKDFAVLSKVQKSSLLFLEGTIDGASKAARKLVKGESPSPPPPVVEVEEEPSPEPPPTPSGGGTPPSGNKSAKPDYGKCPNCAGTKWDEDDDGVSCSRCHHPHGEPAGDADEDRVNTQRAKTVKTVEALMRAFDDLQVMKAKREHDEAIQVCKNLLKIAKGWK